MKIIMGWHLFVAGDRVKLSIDPNRVRRYVITAVTDGIELQTFIRPSRGFRRHVRRTKAATRSIQVSRQG